MQLPRFRLSGLMGSVAVIAAGIVGMHSVSRGWGAVTLLGSVIILLTAILRSIYGIGTDRAFWFGMALFGWCYMFLAFAPWSNEWQYLIDYPPKALRAVLFSVSVPQSGDQTVLQGMDTDYDPATKQTLGWPAWHTFGPIAHSLIALLFGLAGGTIAQNFYSRPSNLDSCSRE